MTPADLQSKLETALELLSIFELGRLSGSLKVHSADNTKYVRHTVFVNEERLSEIESKIKQLFEKK